MVELGVLYVFYADAIKLRQQALVLVWVHAPGRVSGFAQALPEQDLSMKEVE